MRIRKEGLGNRPEAGIQEGDLYIEVTVLHHERFARRGDDLETPLHLSPARAVPRVGHPDHDNPGGDTVQADIPPGVQQEVAVKIVGEGVKRDGRCGDLLIRIRIDIPQGITAEERDLYRRLLESRIEEKR